METLNIAYHGGNTANYNLRGEPVKLTAKELAGYRPDGDGWEPLWKESNTAEDYINKMRLRGSRKQIAARRAIPKSTVTIVKLKVPVAKAVADAILSKQSPDEIKIAELKARIKTMMAKLVP